MPAKEGSEEKFWENVAARYWYVVLLIGIVLFLGFIWFILNVGYYVQASTIGANGTWTLNDFSMATIVFWCLNLIVPILLICVLPVLGAVALILLISWFQLPSDVKAEVKAEFKRPAPKKRHSGGGGFSFLVCVGVCIKIWLDGNWFTPFGSLPYGYFVYTWLFVCFWGLIVFGIPLGILITIWLVAKSRGKA